MPATPLISQMRAEHLHPGLGTQQHPELLDSNKEIQVTTNQSIMRWKTNKNISRKYFIYLRSKAIITIDYFTHYHLTSLLSYLNTLLNYTHQSKYCLLTMILIHPQRSVVFSMTHFHCILIWIWMIQLIRKYSFPCREDRLSVSLSESLSVIRSVSHKIRKW